ncbi:calcium-binding protein [Rubellimicrobium rubrum]|nr:calcium-binding protein [Rubellimicrobium rubrum]
MAVRRWGPEVQANLTMVGDQSRPDVTALADGGYVLTWLDLANPLVSAARFQRFDAAGTPIGAEGLVPASGPVINPTVTTLSGGGFVVVVGVEAVTGDRDVLGFRYDATGTLAAALPLDVSRSASAAEPVLMRLGSGFMTVHESSGDLFARRYDAAGALVGGDSAVNAVTLGFQGRADLAELALGGFVATWIDENLGRVEARVFQADGSPYDLGEFQVNMTSLGGNPAMPKVTGLTGGGFVVTWETSSSPYPNRAPDIRARIFDPYGTAIAWDFVVNPATAGAQILPDVTALADGGFVVVWIDNAGTPSIRGQVFDPFGGRMGGAFLISTTPLSGATEPRNLSVSALADGRLVVAWQAPDDSGTGIFHQIVDPREGVVNGSADNDVLHGNDAWGDEISGFAGNDTLIGLRGDDLLLGADGNDLLRGGRGEDMIHGGRGNDSLMGGAGADDLWGGVGSDVATYAGAGSGVTLALDGSLGAGSGDAAGDWFMGVESVLGSSYDDRLRGDGAANAIRGSSGADILEGGGGADSLIGDSGSDSLIGGAGQDSMAGGTSPDDFAFLSVADSSLGATCDRITDFVKGADDLTLIAIDANEGLAGDQAFTLDADGIFTAGEIRQTQSGANLLIELNTDADALPEMAILLLNVSGRLAATDFDL